jgi:hypothetical protein
MNGYRGAKTVIVLGWVQRPRRAIGAAMRRLFDDGADPLVLAHGAGGRAVDLFPGDSVHLVAHDAALPAEAPPRPPSRPCDATLPTGRREVL